MTSTNELRDHIAKLFQAFAGQQNTLTIPRPYLTLCDNDHRTALLLSQIVYWSDRATLPDGWFAKSAAEWEEELGMTTYQVKRSMEALKALGVQTELRRSPFHQMAATLHYRLDRETFSNRVCEFLENGFLGNSQTASEETSKRDAKKLANDSTEPTTKPTTKPTNKASLPDGNKPASSNPIPSMQDAVAHTWNIKPGGYAGKLITQLTGKNASGQRKQWAIAPPMTPIEVLAFGLWYEDAYPDASMVEKAEALHEKVLKFRDDPDYADYLHDGQTLAEDLMEPRRQQPDEPEDDQDGEVIDQPTISDEQAQQVEGVMSALLNKVKSS
jgi:biotin operon repressor